MMDACDGIEAQWGVQQVFQGDVASKRRIVGQRVQIRDTNPHAGGKAGLLMLGAVEKKVAQQFVIKEWVVHGSTGQ